MLGKLGTSQGGGGEHFAASGSRRLGRVERIAAQNLHRIPRRVAQQFVICKRNRTDGQGPPWRGASVGLPAGFQVASPAVLSLIARKPSVTHHSRWFRGPLVPHHFFTPKREQKFQWERRHLGGF